MTRDNKFPAMLLAPCKAVLVMFLLLACGTAAAQVFKWMDADGNTHYSEHPPAGQRTQELHTQPVPPTVNSSTINNPASQFMQQEEMEHFARKSAEEAQAKSADEKIEAARRARCAQAKNDLNGFQQQVRIFTIGNDGQRIYMDDETRATYIDRAKKEIRENCDSD